MFVYIYSFKKLFIFLKISKPKLTIEQRAQAILMLENGFSTRDIAAKVGCGSHSSIVRLKKKYQETGKVENKKRTGRPCKLNDRNERTIIRRLINGECSNAIQLQKSLKTNDEIEVSSNTVRRALQKNGLVARVKRKKPLLSKKHREKRLKFAKRYKDWTISDWNKVVWSDESKFQIFGSDGRQYCWKKKENPLKMLILNLRLNLGAVVFLCGGASLLKALATFVK